MRLNSTSAVILGVLHDGESTIGEICAAASARLAAQGGVTRSQAYREIPALQRAGLIRLGELRAYASQAYALTKDGRRAFRTWVTEQNSGDSVRSATILRMSFGRHLSPQQRASIIRRARQEHERALAEHSRQARQLRQQGDLFGAAATEFAVAYEQAFLTWLESVPTA